MSTTEPMTIDAAAESLLSISEPETEEVEVEEIEDINDAEEVDVDELDSEEDDGEAIDTEEDDDDPEEEAPEQPTLYDVPVDGQIKKVTLEELTQSFSGQSYIQKGMQEAADLKKQAESQLTALQEQQLQLAALHQNLQQNGAIPAPVRPDPTLASTDPIGYVEAMGKFEAENAAYTAQQQEFSRVTQEQTQAQQRAMQSHLQEQRKILEREIPEFSDPEKGKQLMTDLRTTGQKYGFSDEELSGLTDARAVSILHKAMLWDNLQNGKGVADKKAKKARPVVTPKAPRKLNKVAKARDEAKKRLKQTGSVDDAVSLLMGN